MMWAKMNEATKHALENVRGHKKDSLREQLVQEKYTLERLNALQKHIAALRSDIEDITETLGDGNGVNPS